jgi:hypothetical protein
MRARRLVGALLVGAMLAAGSQAAVGAAGKTKEPSDKFCTAINQHYQVGFLVALAAAFAEGLGDKENKKPAEEARNTLLFVLSPKLEKLTRTMAQTAPDPQLAKALKRQSKAFKQGIALLRDTGVPDKAIKTLADLPLDSDTDPDQIVGDAHISKKKIAAAAKKFGTKYGDQLSGDSLPRSVQRAYTDAGAACGVFPDRSISCGDVVKDADVEAIMGPIEKTEGEGGSCKFEGADPPNAEPNKVIVDVYASARAFDTLSKTVKNQSVPDLGDEAVALEGMNTFTSASTCGRTLIVRDGDRTVVGAACVRDGEVDITQLTQLVQDVLDALSSG